MGRREPKPPRGQCPACRGVGTRTTFDHDKQKHMVTECPRCRGKGKV